MSKLYENEKMVDGSMEQIQSSNSADPSHVDTLTDKLTEYLDRLTLENFDESELDQILDELDSADPTPEFDVDASLAQIHSQYHDFFDSSASDGQPATAEKRASRRFPRRIVPVAATIGILLCSMLTVQAFGYDVFGAIARWTAGIFNMQSVEVPFAR